MQRPPAFAAPAPRSVGSSQPASTAFLSRQPKCIRASRSGRARWVAKEPAPGAAFSTLFDAPDSDSVLNLQNEPVSLVSHIDRLSSTHAAVLVGWLRHFGCTLCKKQAADWRDLAPRLLQCGDVALVLVGNGTPEHAREFVQEIGWQGDMFTDPRRTTYAALGLRKGLGATFNLPALKKVITSFDEGNKQTWSRLPTDAFQQGGAVLVDGDGKVFMFHADAFAGDHVNVDILYEKVCAACQAPAQTPVQT